MQTRCLTKIRSNVVYKRERKLANVKVHIANTVSATAILQGRNRYH